MKNWYQSLSLRSKQTIIIIVINAFSLLVASALYFYNNINSYEKTQILQLESKVQVISGSVISSLLFHDLHAAQAQLSSLTQDKNIVYVGIYDEQKAFFANYESRQHYVRPNFEKYSPGIHRSSDSIEIVTEIKYNEDVIGYLFLVEDTSELSRQIQRHAIITLSVFLMSLLLAYLLSMLLQRWLSKPLNDVVKMMHHITTNKDYNQRLKNRSNDEIGQLISSFNTMLDTVKQRDDKLRSHGEELEDLVSLRTRQLHQRSNYDSLTKLPNRHFLIEQLEHQIYIAQQDNSQIAVLFLDLDRFKVINDNLGHAIGDEVLKIAAQRLTTVVSNKDNIARWGGDEFVIFLTNISNTQLIDTLVQHITEELEKVIQLANREFHISTSIGISLFPDHGKDALTLLKNADISMYRAKDMGAGSHCYYDISMDAGALDRLNMETKLRYAVEHKLFNMVYQPKINIKNHSLAGVEALIRWHDAELGFVSPGQFIPLAEEIGLINRISDFVIEAACKQHAAWRAAGVKPINIAINLPPSSLAEANIVEKIQQQLAHYQIDPQHIELEITEETFLDSGNRCLENLNQLNKSGFRIAIDDFGTGYSCLSYLMDLPVNTLKIDGSFVRKIGTNPQNDGIVNAIMTLGHGLDLDVVAECVETEEQLEFLQNNGCDIIQGYYFSKPLNPDDLAQYAKKFTI